MEKLVSYGVLLIGLMVLAYGLFGIVNGVGSDNGYHPARLQNTPENYQYYQQQAAGAGSECGDLNDVANLQHLSHHPDRFQECYKVVDPVAFKQAVGRDVSEFIR